MSKEIIKVSNSIKRNKRVIRDSSRKFQYVYIEMGDINSNKLTSAHILPKSYRI